MLITRALTRMVALVLVSALVGAIKGAHTTAHAESGGSEAITWAMLNGARPLASARTTPLAGRSFAVAPDGERERLAYCAPGGILITEDGGVTWTATSLAPVTEAAARSGYPLLPRASEPACTSLALDPNARDTLYAVFQAAKAEFGAPPIVFLGVYTTDGGASWRTVPVPDGLTLEQFGGFRVQAGAVQALFAVPTPSGPPDVLIAQTRDGGQTWQAAPPDCPATGPCVRWGPAPNLIGSCSMSGRYQPLIRSDDGGLSWTRVTLPGPAGAANGCVRNELAVLSETELLALKEDAENLAEMVLYSNDGGETWTGVALPPFPGGRPQQLRGLGLLPDGSLLARGQAAGWQRLLPGAAAWCSLSEAALNESQTEADTFVVVGDRLWWLAESSAGPAAMSVPLDALRCDTETL